MSDKLSSEYHQAASTTWGASGRHYDEMSFMVSDALGHAAQRIQAQPSERILDVATGTGWTARNLARSGANVTAIDLSEPLLEAAGALSAHCQPPIEFKRADAQDLPFKNGEFDVVSSTFGVMFAPDHEQAARELARVCRPGGRLCLATWIPIPMFPKTFELIAKYDPRPAQDHPPPSPFLWGEEDHVESLLGDAFELCFETGINCSYHPDGDQIASLYERSFGPTAEIWAQLDPEKRKDFHAEMAALNESEAHQTAAGLRMERPYLLVLGTRRG